MGIGENEKVRVVEDYKKRKVPGSWRNVLPLSEITDTNSRERQAFTMIASEIGRMASLLLGAKIGLML